MKRVDIISKVVGRSDTGKPVGGGISIPMGNYALKSDFESLKSMFNDFLEGDDTDSVINRWKDLEAFLDGISEDNTLDSILKAYVTLSGTQTIIGEKNFTGGLKVNGSPIYYDTEKKYWKLEGDLLVTGGVTMYGNEGTFTPSTIMDAIAVDGTTISKEGGILKVIGDLSGGATTLGSLANVGSWADSVASQDRIMYQAANSSQWVAKNLSDLAVGGVTGDYLPLSGGTLTNTLTIDNSDVGLILHRSGQKTPYIRFGQDTNNEWGELGVYNDGRLVFWPLVSSQGGYNQWNTVWHSGNDGSGSGLDADLLDGKHYSDIINGNVASATRLQAYQHNSGENKLISGTRTDNTFPRYIYDNGWGLCLRWQEGNGVVHNGTIATLNDNVASATKLQTPRTIWGQSFDGTGDITGKLTFSELNGNIPAIQFKNGEVIDAYGNIQMYSTTNTWSIGLNYSPLFCVTGSGNVGIGTTNPSFKLHVAGGVLSDAYYAVGGIYGWNADTSVTFNNRWGMYQWGHLLQITQRDVHNNFISSPISIDLSNGMVAIAKKQPTCALDVSGNILASGGITMYSARKLKNITDERGLSLKELSVIKPTRFTWKDGRDNRLHIGGIADDVMKVLPEVIYKTGEDDTLTMDYGNAAFAIAASLIKPVVNHEERIKVLEEENKRLKEEVEQLKWNIA